ncbi:hypothetical protein GCM10028813_01160 [Ramlibacter alkalitolerans]
MRANLNELTKAMRPVSDERARELVRELEAAAGRPGDGYLAAESELRDEFWERARALNCDVSR